MRYALLVLLNLPIIMVALLNAVTQFKVGRISARRFKLQILLWLTLLLVLLASFPLYNILIGAPVFDAHTLSLLDVVQTTALVYLFYIANDLRRKIDRNERTIRDLHQELSIKLSEKNDKN